MFSHLTIGRGTAKPPNGQALTTPGQFGEQRRNKDADQEHAYDPKVGLHPVPKTPS
jgi:hypothetical protein